VGASAKLRIRIVCIVATALFAPWLTQPARADICNGAPVTQCQPTPLGETSAGTDGSLTVDGVRVMESTGSAYAPTSVDQIQGLTDVPPPVSMADKEAGAAAQLPAVDKALLMGQIADATSSPQTPSQINCDMPCAASLADTPLFYQRTHYTCAPASGRIVVAEMTGVDPSETAMTNYMKTHTDGTIAGNIPPALNRYPRPRNDHFTVKSPGSADHYMNDVAYDVNQMFHDLIDNIFAAPLTYMSHRRLHHYHVAYGYDLLHNSGTVDIAEEWDPAQFDSSWRELYPNGNPYGYHAVPLSQEWEAISEQGDVIVW